MQELWRKPDTVSIHDFDSSMYPYLMNYVQSNEQKESVEQLRKQYMNTNDPQGPPLTEEECNALREKLGASFVLDSYNKQELRSMLEKKGKQKRNNKDSIQEEEDEKTDLKLEEEDLF